MNTPTVLVIDDEPYILRFIRTNLRAAGYEVTLAGAAAEALAACEQQAPELILLDLGLPDMDGLDLFTRLRRLFDAPIIILTARGSSVDKVRGLDLGADDYIVKPFDVDELLARVRAVLRRVEKRDTLTAPSEYEIGPLTLNLARHEAWVHGEPVHLTPTEFKLLGHLAAHADKVILHGDLLSHVWGPEYRDSLEYLRVTVGRIRQKLGADQASRELIQTIPGVGYKLVRP